MRSLDGDALAEDADDQGDRRIHPVPVTSYSFDGSAARSVRDVKNPSVHGRASTDVSRLRGVTHDPSRRGRRRSRRSPKKSRNRYVPFVRRSAQASALSARSVRAVKYPSVRGRAGTDVSWPGASRTTFLAEDAEDRGGRRRNPVTVTFHSFGARRSRLRSLRDPYVTGSIHPQWDRYRRVVARGVTHDLSRRGRRGSRRFAEKSLTVMYSICSVRSAQASALSARSVRAVKYPSVRGRAGTDVSWAGASRTTRLAEDADDRGGRRRNPVTVTFDSFPHARRSHLRSPRDPYVT
jgi:hypothetical protein